MADAAATRKAIQKAVVDAMETKPVPEITITEICDTCHIARSTFYRYFDSVDDVLKKTGDELLTAIKRVSSLDKYDAVDAPMKPRQSDLARAQILKEYAPFILAATGYNGDPSFAQKAAKLISDQFFETAGESFRRQPYSDFLVEFIKAGLFRTVDYWLRDHPEMSPEEYYGLQRQMLAKLGKLFSD